jgi:hypothetical protein
MTTFKTILATAAAVAISATALTSTSAFAFLPSNHFSFTAGTLSHSIPQGPSTSITTFGVPGGSSTSAPSRPSATPNPPPLPPCYYQNNCPFGGIGPNG